MALTAPTVATDPPTQTEMNDALATINGYVTTSYTEFIAAFDVIRDHVRIANGMSGILEEFDATVRTLASSAVANPSVASNPAPFAGTNNALVTMASIIDRLNSRTLSTFRTLRNELRLTDGITLRLDRFDTGDANLGSPATLTAEAVTTDVGPGTVKAEVDTALANTTAFLDTAKSEILTMLNEFAGQYSIVASPDRSTRLAAAIAAVTT